MCSNKVLNYLLHLEKIWGIYGILILFLTVNK